MTTLAPTEIDRFFAFLKPAGQHVKNQLLKHVTVRQFPAGQYICLEGDSCEQLAIVLSGLVRVYKVGAQGREITLYRIEENDSCILTASCILSHIRFPALAVVEKDVRAALIPSPILRQWIAEYDVWREYVFGLMSKRLAEVIAIVEEIAFQRVDIRIAGLLVEKIGDKKSALVITHQEIASELGTAREVVSRILKNLERENIITLNRGSITICNKHALLAKINSQ